jgi:hypothetical protein
MVQVESIKINLQIPSDEVRIVAMQPFIKLQFPKKEPIQWAPNEEDEQFNSIKRTLDIAEHTFGGKLANFILFPEYSIPGIAGVSIINDRISNGRWSNDSIIIGGVHGIAKNEYRELCDLLGANVNKLDAPDSIPANKWVNCCVIWIKDHEGLIHKWIQLKVRPAWPEMNVNFYDMFCGNIMYVFEGHYIPSKVPCKFVTFICFDWVASFAGTTVCEEFLSNFTILQNMIPTSLDWVIVVQHNSGPNHPAFLNSTNQFLTDTHSYPFIERDKSIVIHANTAVSHLPSRSGLGGYSACVFSPSAQLDCTPCRPTVCMKPSVLRNSNTLDRCKDIVFREMGECIHAFTIRVPRFIIPNATDRTYPMPIAGVYSVSESRDPRLSNGPVSASVKWTNDSLDHISKLSEEELEGCHLKSKAQTIESEIIDALRPSEDRDASNLVNFAACTYSHRKVSRDESRRHNSDIWETEETNAINHVVHSITSLGLAFTLEFNNSVLHSTIKADTDYIQIVAIQGDTHEDCRLHYDKFVPKVSPDPVLVIACDKRNLIPTKDEYMTIYEIPGEGGLTFLDYQTLITYCRNAKDSETLKHQIDEIIHRQTRII